METVITVLAIVACLLLFSAAIFIHEFGHFLAARKRGLTVEAFSIGFGPVLWKKEYDGVEWRISAIPFGGYVAIPDVDPEGTAKAQGSESKKNEGKKATPIDAIIVAVAGPMGNVVLAVALAIGLALVPSAKFGELASEIGEVPEKGPAHDAGMMAGDRIKAIDGRKVSTWYEMQTEVQISGGREQEFLIDRNGQELKLKVKPERNEASGAYYILAFSTTNGMAVAWMPARNPLKQLAWDAGSIARVLKALVTPKEAKAAAKAIGGPVMIGVGIYSQVRKNPWDALGFLRFLCVNLAILNLLPIPVLDGSIVMFALYELIRKKKAPQKLTDALTKVFMVLLLGLMLFLVWRDSSRVYKIHQAAKEVEKAEVTK